MELNRKPADTKKLKGFTLLELIIVCALFSMILLGALSILRPISLLYKQNVEYESSRAVSDVVSGYLEGVLKYSNRIFFYEDQNATAYEENTQKCFESFVNKYFDGKATEKIYMLDVINDPVVNGAGEVTNEGYGRLRQRDIAASQVSPVIAKNIDVVTLYPSDDIISRGIYTDYGFQINIENALPQTLTTTVNVYRKNKLVSATQVKSSNGIMQLLDDSNNLRYEANGVEVVTSTRMLNLSSFDLGGNPLTDNEILVYNWNDELTALDDTVGHVSPSYSDRNALFGGEDLVDETTPASNNFHVIFTLPDEAYYEEAAKLEIQELTVTPDIITVDQYSDDTTDAFNTLLEGLTVRVKYVKASAWKTLPMGDGETGWKIDASSPNFDTSTVGDYVFKVYFSGETKEFTIRVAAGDAVSSISADELVWHGEGNVTSADFNVYGVTVKDASPKLLGGTTYTAIVLDADGNEIEGPAGWVSSISAPGIYRIKIKFNGNYVGDERPTVETRLIIPTLASITATKLQTQYNVGTPWSNDLGADITVTANYIEGVSYEIPYSVDNINPTIVSGFDASVTGVSSIVVSYTERGNTAQATIPITIYDGPPAGATINKVTLNQIGSISVNQEISVAAGTLECWVVYEHGGTTWNIQNNAAASALKYTYSSGGTKNEDSVPVSVDGTTKYTSAVFTITDAVTAISVADVSIYKGGAFSASNDLFVTASHASGASSVPYSSEWSVSGTVDVNTIGDYQLTVKHIASGKTATCTVHVLDAPASGVVVEVTSVSASGNQWYNTLNMSVKVTNPEQTGFNINIALNGTATINSVSCGDNWGDKSDSYTSTTNPATVTIKSLGVFESWYGDTVWTYNVCFIGNTQASLDMFMAGDYVLTWN